ADNVVRWHALSLAFEHSRNHLSTACVVVDHPSRQSDRRIDDPVQCLWTIVHLDGVTEAILVEEVQLIPRLPLIGCEVCWRRLIERKRLRDVCRDCGRHVGMNAEQTRWLLYGHELRDGIAPVSALRYVSLIAEALHQGSPCAGDAGWGPSRRRRLPREAVAGQRWDHDVERVLRAPAEGRWVDKRVDVL